MRHHWKLAIAAMLLAGPATAMEDMIGNADGGRAIALSTCSQCHVVALKQRRPAPPVPNVPSFYALANDSGKTEFYLRSFFRTPHKVMPNFMLTAKETDDILAYLRSLKGKHGLRRGADGAE